MVRGGPPKTPTHDPTLAATRTKAATLGYVQQQLLYSACWLQHLVYRVCA